jgi:hypothetical protein
MKAAHFYSKTTINGPSPVAYSRLNASQDPVDLMQKMRGEGGIGIGGEQAE